MAALVAGAATNDLAIAKAALRDGLWNVARAHAAKAPGDEARLVVLETYAHEGNWKGLLAAIDAMGYPAGDGFAYYRAAALFKDGLVAAASNVLAGAAITNETFVRPAARLRAEIARTHHDLAGALKILEEAGPGNRDEVETTLLMASIHAEAGERAAAQRLWQAVAANTNASEQARAEAAVGIGDKALLKALAATARASSVRHYSELQLGMLLSRDDVTAEEGERMIRRCVRARPDAEGARAAFRVLADALLSREAWARAEQTFADALAIWPDAAKDAALHEGRGWALFSLGRMIDAAEAFRRAEGLAEDPARKAANAVKVADALAALGRMQEATSAYQSVLSNYPGTAAAARVAEVVRLRETEEKGRARYRAFKFDEAKSIFDALAREDPSHRDQLAFYCALCSYGSGDVESAEAAVRRLAARAKSVEVRAQATLWIAKLTFNRKDWHEAKKMFDRYVACAPKAADAPQALVWSARASLSAGDFKDVIVTVAKLVSDYPDSPARAAGMLAQGEALVELARFDEAVLVLDRVPLVAGVADADRLAARILRADALFAMGADNPSRYEAALESYDAIRTGEVLSPGQELSISFKVAKTLEKLKRLDEAIDAYYTRVVLAYRMGRIAGTRYDDAARATFARAAFRLVEEYESRGRVRQAIHVLELVRTSDVQAAGEAANRMERLMKKGMFE